MADDDTPSIYDVFGEPPEVDPNRFGPVPVVPGEDAESAPAAPLPHWSAPPTGQTPRVQTSEPEVWDDLSGPRWRGERAGWADDDLEVVFGDEKSAVRHDDILNFDDPRLNAPAPPRPDLDLDDPFGEAGSKAPSQAAAPTDQPKTRRAQAAGSTRSRRAQPPGNGLGRNMGQAIGVGVGLAAVALAAILLHPLVGTVLIAAVAGLAAVEFFDAVRHGDHHPATMLGLTGAALFPLAAYWRGEQAYPVLMAVTVVFGGLWYIVGADRARPLTNLSITLLGVFWIGGSASFGALLLNLSDGQKMLIGAIAITAIADTAAFFGGRTFKGAFFGERAFNPWSPGKSWEGTLFGIVGATVGALVLDALFSVGASWWHAAVFGLVLGAVGVVGDLFESMLKRDLKLKDMGALLPGHGGILDRVDALLFVLPAAYFVARVLDYA
ncbi:MAG: phosphatidate cytidylyltransferase [Acidimicrobiales bacterium]|nr:phosphatidate cytidylyltransferase [Acidimicrobiales bacterium]